ncbi:MAG: polyprenyl synthetase family protein [Pseudomonadota bacterium]
MAVSAEVQQNKPRKASENGAMSGTPLDRLHTLLNDDLAEVERLLADRAASPVATIPDMSGYLIDAGGKRLRPIVTLAAAKAASGDRTISDGGAAIKLAAAVEFIHTATLLHDDVVDDSDLRRGKAAAKNLWGASASILVGDFLFAKSFTLMVETESLKILDILSTAATVIAEGEVRQLSVMGRTDVARDEYMAIVEAKTAALFEAAARAGAIAAVGEGPTSDALGEYGRRLGRAFQLVDDALDYGGATAVIGKSVGDDFREGKLTLPVLVARERASEEDKAFWERALDVSRQTEEDLPRAIALIRATGAVSATLKAAREEATQAKKSLLGLSETAARDELALLADYCVDRAF